MAEAPTSRKRIIAAGVVGNLFEWYDFSIYGFFAVQIGRTFFRSDDPVSQVLAAFGVFALGFLVRPLGALAIGYLGDRFGRTFALTLSIGGMAVPTVLIGLLPGYDTLGVAAPILLTLLRMMQGLAVGGEAAIAGVFLVESAPPGRRGLVGALGGFGNGLGIQIGSVTAAICASLMSPEDLAAWGWRIPFLLGIAVGVVGFLLRRNLRDAAAAAPPRSPGSPLVEVARHHIPLVLRIAGLVAFNAIAFNLAFLYIVHWLQEVDGIAPARALQINTISMLAIMPVSLTMGWLSDHIGRRGILLVAATIGIVGAVPFFALMHSTSTLSIMLGQLGFVLAVGMAFGVMPALTTETTPLGVRCTALALGNNISYSILGGMMPLAATWLVYRTGNDYSPAYLIVAAAALTLIAALCHPESYRTDFKTLASKPA
jgi:MHS family proline/betaine transporter-like MFS transporter